MTEYDREEREILDAFDKGETRTPSDAEAIKQRHREYAGHSLRKDARINVRLTARDLRALQKRALAEGIPYQTLIASILHKYVEGRLGERD